MNEARKRFGIQLCGTGICGAADESGEKSVSLWPAARKERGIPDRAETAQPGRARNQKPKTLE